MARSLSTEYTTNAIPYFCSSATSEKGHEHSYDKNVIVAGVNRQSKFMPPINELPQLVQEAGLRERGVYSCYGEVS